MDIFRRRPLFLCCFGFTLASLAGFFLPLAGKLVLGGCLLVGALLFCLWRVRCKDAFRSVLGGALCLLALAGLLLSHMWFYKGNAAALRELEGKTVTVTVSSLSDRSPAIYPSPMRAVASYPSPAASSREITVISI